MIKRLYWWAVLRRVAWALAVAFVLLSASPWPAAAHEGVVREWEVPQVRHELIDQMAGAAVIAGVAGAAHAASRRKRTGR